MPPPELPPPELTDTFNPLLAQEDEGELRASLLPILASGGGQVQRMPQDPLIKILLGIPDVQPRLVQMLFDK
jgi:hypothetical protein